MPRRLSFSVFTCVAALALAAVPGCRTPEAAPPPASTVSASPLRTLDYAGDQSATAAVDREIAAARNDAAALRPIAETLLAVLHDRSASPAGRQAAAERLALFPASLLLDGSHRAAFIAQLANEQDSNLARLALDGVPGAEVDAVYVAALRQSRGAAQLALIQSAGNRRIASSIRLLSGWLGNSDEAIAQAVAKALGQIGTSEALQTLNRSDRRATAPLLEARIAAAQRLGGKAGVATLREIAEMADAPAALRGAATRALLFAEPASTAQRLAAAVSGQDPVVAAAVIEALAAVPGQAIVTTVTNQLTTLSPGTQAALIAALARRGDAAAVPAIVAATRHPDAGVRAAAITALGDLPGNPETAEVLARLAAGEGADDAKLARASLARLNGPGVADKVTSGATSGDATLRSIYLTAIADRNMAGQVPLLLATRSDADARLRAAALTSLAEIAPASTQADVLDWTLSATDNFEQPRALRALTAVTLRNPNETERARPIIAALDRAPAPVAARVVPVLGRIGGRDAAECAGRIALGDDAAAASAATTVLARWTDQSGLVPLVDVAEKATREATRNAAVVGAIRYLERSRSLPSPELGDLVRRLVAVATESEARSQLVYLLGRADDSQTLAFAEQLQADPALASVANDAVQAIKTRQLGAPAIRVSTNDREARSLLDGKPNTSWGAKAEAGQWIELDFHGSRPFRTLVIEGSEYNYPEHIELFVTDDPQNPGTALASVDGSPNRTAIELPQVAHGRYLVIRHSKTREDSWWTVSELLID